MSPGAAWSYLGTDLRRRAEVTRALSDAHRVRIGEPLNQIAHRLKEPFSAWVADLGSAQPQPWRWWASRLASKSPVQTDFFLLLCYAELVSCWIDGRLTPRPAIVVVEDPWLLQMLRQRLGDASGVVIGWSSSRVILDAAYWLARIPYAALWTLRWGLWSRWLGRRWFADVRPRGEDPSGTLIYTWVEPRCFPSPGAFEDPYTGRLEQVLRQQGQRVWRMTPPKLLTDLLYRLRELPDASRFVLTQRYLRAWDIVRASASLCRIAGWRQAPPCAGFDARLLLRRELLREWGNPNYAFYVLSYFATKRLARAWRGAIARVIYTFENQPWEKLLCLAFHEKAPEVQRIGYQHTCINPLWLNYFPAKTEFAFAPMPDRIIANGALSLALMRDGGYPAERLADGGAFRYEYLFAQRPAVTQSTPRAEYRVLVVFSVSELHSGALLQDLLDLFASDSLAGRPIRFILKCHPRTPPAGIVPRDRALPTWFAVSDEPLSRLLQTVDAYLYVPPTTTRWEAYLAGLPTLKYLDDFLDMDAVELPGEPLTRTCTKPTLRAALEAALTHRDPPPSPERRREVLQQVFSPVQEEQWAAVAAGAP